MTKSKLITLLKNLGTANPVGNKKQIIKLCQTRGLPLTVSEEKLKEGWLNKPKGAMQILFERGWIDPKNIHLYTEKGKKKSVSHGSNDSNESGLDLPVDPSGCNYSIEQLMKKQSNFANELTLLQYHGQKLGVLVD